MSDKEYFNFENGKMFKFADLRKKIRRDSFSDSQLKKVFNIFDTDSSGALEVSNSRGENELVSLWNRLKSAATRNNEGDDNVLDDSEIDFFVKNNLGVDTNVTVDQLKAFIQNIFSLKQESENTYTPLQIEYTEEDIKENAKNTISNNVSKGLELFYGQNENQGYVSDLVNDFKENFNTQMAASRINRWLLREEYSSMLINQADSDSGLTKRDYYMAKIDLLSKLLPEITHKKIAGKINGMMRLFSGNLIALAMQLGIDDIEGLSDEELQTLCEKELLYEALMRLPMDKINTLISTLCTIPDDEFASFESPEISTAIDEVVNFVTDNSHLTGEIPKEKIFTPAKGSVKELILQNSSSEKLSFEETFYEERKVPYNKAFVEDYAQKSSYLEYLVAVNNRVSEINEKLNKHLNAIKSETSNGMVYDSRAMYTMLNDVVNSVLNDIYNGDAEKIQEFLDSVFGKGKAKVSAESSADTCPIKIDVDGSAFSMQMLAEAIINKNNETLAKLLNGKSLEEYSTEVKEAYFFAYGNNNSVDFAEEYTKSQQEGVQNTKVVVQATGMVIMICGQLIPVVGQAGGALGGTAFATLGKVGVLGGTTLATFGSVGVSAVENVLKPGGVTQQDKKEMLQELTDSIMLFSSGVAGGKLAEGVFKAMVLKNCPKLIAFASEVGVDATCSLLSDLAITGQIDLSGEGIAQLQNILTGIILSKGNFKTYLNTHAGDLTPKGKTPQVTEIKNSQQNRNTNGSEIIFKETSDLIVKKLNSPSRDHISEESTNLQLAEFKKLFEKYPEIPQELIINLIDNPNIRMRVRNGSVDFNMFADILELTSRYPEHQIELLKLLKSDEYNYSNIKEALSNPKFIEIARIAGCKFALTNLKDGILDIGIDKYEQLNRVLYGKAASELSAIKENFETQNGITLHIDNNVDPHKASEYAKMLNEVIERYYVAGKEPPKEIYITNLVPENADGVAWARRYPDVIAVRPIDDIERFKHNVFHEAAHLTDMTMKIRDLQYQPIGTKLSVENGKLTRICDKAYGEELKKSITAYIGWYAATDTNEFTAEVGAMLFENKITVKQTEVNGEITTEVIINEPFINNDGVTIKITPEIRAEIEKIIDYYFEIGGQNFSHTPDNQSLSRRNVSLNQPADATDYRQTAVSGVVEEVAPFAKHLERTPDIQDLTNPEIKKVVLENGEFDENGDFISDGTYTVTESGKPGAKSVTYKRYPDGDRRIAQNMDELFEQVLKLRDIKELSQSEKWQIEAFVNAHPELSIAEISELAQDYNHILGNISNLFDTDYSYIKNIPDLRILKANISEFDKFSFKYRNVPGYSIVDIRTFFDNMSEINPEDYKFVLNNLEEGNLRVLHRVDKENVEFTKLILKDKDIPREHIAQILEYTNADNLKFAEELVTTKDIPREHILSILQATNDEIKQDFARNLCKNYKQMEIPADKILFLINNYGNISPKDLQKLNHVMGRDKVAKLSNSDMLIACQMVDVCGKTSINEIPMEGRQTFLRKLVGCNTGLFTVSDEVKKAFPLIPTDRETYCSLLPSIVKSLGVDIRTIEPPSRIKEFNTNLESLSSSVAKLSDRDFANMEITLDYPKNEFIKNVLNIVKDLNPQERQKVYDYFGFELHENKNNPTGFSIIGYPINLNNGKKLAEITDPKTKSVVENLRPEVIKFSEQNRVKCNNPDVQKLLNDIVDVLPELRTQIGKVQHKTHDYDVFKHSLKVMQKITQDPKFQTLNESDKKLMMLASLLHDITKGEGYSDKTHAAQGSFDTFFIAKKFNLTREEEIKLYTLTRHHEWLEYVNTAKSETELTKRLQSVAYDLQHDNLFDMALMFTHADLRAVKSDDTFHDTKVGASRVDFNGNVRSFGEAADVYAQRIRNYIKELQKSQPLLPVTKIPKSDRINSAITKVNPDGSTNIKGVYKRSDGLVVIKFNEVDDWEAIGFPKGSVSKGYMAQAGSKASDGSFAENVNTGNIKFFVHGLDYENQLAKFDAFSLIDSDVLLSVSYAERPESKYRFFRAQGVLLDFDTKYIHGGGNTDSGSGCGKFIEDFKKDYIFGGYREFDRVYVSNLIKNATGMSDEDYVKFVEKNKNRALTEIEPAAYREPIIKALAAINSNTRKGGRSYNEMYGSNPKEVMGVFAYDTSVPSNVDNPLDFLLRRQDTEFLQKYAIEHNLPFVVFGD